jgi:flagellar protein FlgJ
MNVLDVNTLYGPSRQLEQMTRNIQKKDTRLYEACQDFEALFIKQMLSSMKKTINKTGLMEGGMAEEVFEDMLYDEYAKIMSKTARFGLADMIYDQVANPENKSI